MADAIYMCRNGQEYKNPGTHQEHCCKEHGCKYGDKCPVMDGALAQSFPCEYCHGWFVSYTSRKGQGAWRPDMIVLDWQEHPLAWVARYNQSCKTREEYVIVSFQPLPLEDVKRFSGIIP